MGCCFSGGDDSDGQVSDTFCTFYLSCDCHHGEFLFEHSESKSLRTVLIVVGFSRYIFSESRKVISKLDNNYKSFPCVNKSACHVIMILRVVLLQLSSRTQLSNLQNDRLRYFQVIAKLE